MDSDRNVNERVWRSPVGPDVKLLRIGQSREDIIHTHLSVCEVFEPMVITLQVFHLLS